MKKVLIIIVIVFVFMQFFRIDKNNPIVKPEENYVTITHAPKEVESILKSSCYDCHSNESKYPWYTNIAPISWYVKDHINEGRSYLNFSEFGRYNNYQKKHIYESLYAAANEGWMPLDSYLWIHKDAKLSTKDKKILKEWFSKFISEDKKG